MCRTRLRHQLIYAAITQLIRRSNIGLQSTATDTLTDTSLLSTIITGVRGILALRCVGTIATARRLLQSSITKARLTLPRSGPLRCSHERAAKDADDEHKVDEIAEHFGYSPNTDLY